MSKMLGVFVLLVSGALPLLGNQAPSLLEPEMPIHTIYRSSESVVVNTRIHLQVADPDEYYFLWQILQLPAKGALVKVGEDKDYKKLRDYIYVPHIGQNGADKFAYRVVECRGIPPNTDMSKITDAMCTGSYVDGTVTIEIEKQGIRWEIEAFGGSGLGNSGENNDEVIGSTGENFLFKLDWLFNSPRSDNKTDPNDSVYKLADKAGSDLTDSLTVFDPDNASGTIIKAPAYWGRAPQNTRFSFQIGIMNLPVSAELQEQLRAGDEGSSEEAENEEGNSAEDSGDTTLSLLYQRAFTTKMGFSYNFAFDADEEGTTVEFGPMVQGNLDIYLNDDDFTKQNGVTYLNLGRLDDRRGFFGFEAGFRFRLSQLEDDPDTIVLKKDGDGANATYRRMNPRNSENLLLGEVVYQRREALGNLALGETRNRIAARFMASPKVPGSKEYARFLIGVEFSRDFANRGPQDVRLFYGFDVSLPGLFGS